MKSLAATIGLATFAAFVWLWSLSRRPIEMILGDNLFLGLRISSLAIAVGALCSVIAMAAARRGLGRGVVGSIGSVGCLVVVGAARRPGLGSAVTAVVDTAWLAGAAVVVGAIIATSPRSGRLTRNTIATVLVGIVTTGVLAAALAGGSGAGATIGQLSATSFTSTAALALLVHIVMLAAAAFWTAWCLWSRSGVDQPLRHDPIAIAAITWFVVAIAERAVHLLPLTAYRDVYRGNYLPWSLILAVHLPIVANGAVMATLGWSLLVRPHAEHLPSGTLILPDRDPVAMLRDDLAAWIGDPTLRMAYADGNGGWIAQSGEVLIGEPRYDRATTVLTREGRKVGILEYDVALTQAPDAVYAAAGLAGLAFDANQLLAVSEGRLADARRIGERLLVADATTRSELERVLSVGPLGRLDACADNLSFGAPISSLIEPIRQATAEVRHVSHGLYPPELIEGGLSAVAGDRRGAPRRRLPPAVEVTAFQLAAGDPNAWFEDRGTVLLIHTSRETIPRTTLDRIEVLGGTLSAGMVEIPIEES